jgi:hypothetical protein
LAIWNQEILYGPIKRGWHLMEYTKNVHQPDSRALVNVKSRLGKRVS